MNPVVLAAAAATALGSATAAAQDPASFAVAQSAEYGRYLTDAHGRAVYLLESDEKGRSNCYDACATVWPPVLARAGAPRTGNPAVRKELLGTLKRRNGDLQVTYNGHPLYYYVKDRGAQAATGQDLHDRWGEWYLVTPKGTALERAEKSAAAGGRRSSASSNSSR